MITAANQSFVDMSGYSLEELIGAPHHILRHPFMPGPAFKDLWDTISAGKKWHGYVKNLRKDGRYYWVYATVIPNVRNGKIVALHVGAAQAVADEGAGVRALYPTLR